jgi:hypothetical protein
MKSPIRFAMATGLMLLSSGAHAICAAGTGGTAYCGAEVIQLLYVSQTGVVYVQPTSSLNPAPANFPCTPVGGSYFVLQPTAAAFKQIYSLLLSARISGAPITMVSDPTQSACTISYVTM